MHFIGLHDRSHDYKQLKVVKEFKQSGRFMCQRPTTLVIVLNFFIKNL